MSSGYRPELVQSVFANFIGARLNPFWSLTDPKLRLLARYSLSDDLIALEFAVNSAFKRQVFDLHDGWHGGQYLNLTVPIDGIYHQRSYSIVGLPREALEWDKVNSSEVSNKDVAKTTHIVDKHNASRIADKYKSPHRVTIAVKPQGLVSNYLTKQAELGTVFASSTPSGDFTLGQIKLAANSLSNSNLSKKTPLLLIAGGSGITPMLGLITQALQHGHQVTLLHYNRTVLLTSYWQQLALQYPAFRYHLINTEDASTYLADSRHLNAQSLLALDLPLVDTQIFACGSQALLAGLYQAAAEITLPADYVLRDNIIVERFGAALPELNSAAMKDTAQGIESQTVYLRMRQRQFDSDTTLLVAAEQAGIRMTYGCRQGICHMCRCNKVSGVVKNIQTGKVSGDGYESIQTCINIAMTDVVLDI